MVPVSLVRARQVEKPTGALTLTLTALTRTLTLTLTPMGAKIDR